MYMCIDCGEIFDCPREYVDFQGFVGEEPAYEKYCGCPSCGGSFEEAFQCEQCGDYKLKEDLHRGWCRSCVDFEYQNIGFEEKVDILEDYVYKI